MKTKQIVTRGKWEVTLRNLRALKRRVVLLERRAARHERALRYLMKKD